MARAKNTRDGLDILLKHGPEGNCDAQHDVLYGPGEQELPAEDVAALEALGWFWDDEVESWAVFT